MSKFIKLDSTLTSVTSFSGNFDARELSARPEFTADNTYTTLTCGFSAHKTFYGYNFDSVTHVALSCTNNSDLFLSGKELSATYGFTWIIDEGINSIARVPDVSVSFSPNLSGLFVSAGKRILNNYNSMTITFPSTSATGEVDVILINPAGYGKLSTDIGSAITIN